MATGVQRDTQSVEGSLAREDAASRREWQRRAVAVVFTVLASVTGYGMLTGDHYGGEGSYTCNPPLDDVVDPKPVAPARSEGDFNAAPYCNHEARTRLFGGMALLFAMLVGTWGHFHLPRPHRQALGVVLTLLVVASALWGWGERSHSSGPRGPSLELPDPPIP